MTRHRPALLLALATIGIAGACAQDDPDAPPEITYGVSVCVDCDMIISDERYASATIVADSRGRPEALLFDDIGDQIRYEASNPDLTILARWVHDHDTKKWLRGEEAVFLRSPGLRTPMASGIAAFETRAGAEATRDDLGQGEILTMTQLWSAAAPDGAEPAHAPHEDHAP